MKIEHDALVPAFERPCVHRHIVRDESRGFRWTSTSLCATFDYAATNTAWNATAAGTRSYQSKSTTGADQTAAVARADEPTSAAAVIAAPKPIRRCGKRL